MIRSPISILQEIMVAKKQGMPDYHFENSDRKDSPFKCIVEVENITAVSFGHSKKDAKHESAKKALELLGYSYSSSRHLPDIATPSVTDNKIHPPINYVGNLNEFASTRGLPYPVYHDESIYINQRFSTRCEFLEFSCEGLGFKKKDSKQDAARNMLEMLKGEDIDHIIANIQKLQIKKPNQVITFNQEILKQYEKLSVISSPNSKTASITFHPIVNLKETCITLDDLKHELRKHGFEYTLQTFQKDPCIMMMTIGNSKVTVMGRGDNKQEALNDLLENAKVMFQHGFSFQTVF